ncbi:hypothetical protein G7K_4141-t1 [Saitoella complicata NRRL Y-17804]|uniref:Uncharacterized protein n=1 Tax=Saitoella complicata (strain BCRC 22490 / CBS 7301 / JCM 7358 / NBRC 10748 / NRRL Y-17804) TaxID=698492 RepID=A0A0E9NJZ7_SAICN|nr:hypothetical protein G7K_4141-t1 [Saitoella complicata NRRL Y-17804]
MLTIRLPFDKQPYAVHPEVSFRRHQPNNKLTVLRDHVTSLIFFDFLSSSPSKVKVKPILAAGPVRYRGPWPSPFGSEDELLRIAGRTRQTAQGQRITVLLSFSFDQRFRSLGLSTRLAGSSPYLSFGFREVPRVLRVYA